MVWNINTMQSKDTLDRLIGDPDPTKWQVFAGIGDDFCTNWPASTRSSTRRPSRIRVEREDERRGEPLVGLLGDELCGLPRCGHIGWILVSRGPESRIQTFGLRTS
jgi:hypothetical protein